MITSMLVLALGAVFLKGFKEAIGVAVAIVVLYPQPERGPPRPRTRMEIVARPDLVTAFEANLWASHPSALAIVAASLFLFPKLALGLSGFETGVAVMPLVAGDPTDAPAKPARPHPEHPQDAGRGRCIIMSVCLVASSLVTTDADPAGAARARRPRRGPRSGLPRPRDARGSLRHDL
jgi:hypothetical protein